MTQFSRIHLALYIACISTPLFASDITTSNNFLPARPISADITQNIIKQRTFHDDPDELWSLDIFAAPFYQHSFSQNSSTNLGTHVLWSGTNSLDLSQYPVAGVSTGSLKLSPTTSTIGAHVSMLITNNPSEAGMFIACNTTMGRTKLNTHLEFSGTKDDEKTIKEFFNGTKIKDSSKVLLNGLIAKSESSGFNIGDVHLIFGYNLVQQKNKQSQLGLNITFATTESTLAKYALEPLFGNNHHHGLGIQYQGFTQLYEHGQHEWFLHAAGSIEHLFKSTSNKTFDILPNQTTGKVGGKGSKYALITSLPESTKVDTPVANFSTVPVESCYDVVADLALALTYRHHQRCSATLGYNFYAQSKEKFVIAKDTPINSAYLTNSTTLYTISDLDIASCQQPQMYTSKIFISCAHTWDQTLYSPYLQIGGHVEFSHVQNNAVPTWGLQIASGLSF